jgi:aminopeptidase YwaD
VVHVLSREEEAIRSDIDSWKMREHDRVLSQEIGDRFLGTEGDRRSIEYVKKHFTSCGLEVLEDPVETLTFDYRGATLTVGSPVSRNIDCKAAYYSKPTPRVGVEGELTFVGGATEHEIASVDLKGKIAVATAQAGDPMFWLGFHITKAAKLGAVALIICHTSPVAFTPSASYGLWDHTGGWRSGYPPLEEQIPCITIGCHEAMPLLYHVGRGRLSARINVDCITEPRQGFNIRGLLQGKERANEHVVILAHRDDGACSGANDNGSGTAAMLELARIFSQMPHSRRTVEFLSTTSEEGITDGIFQYIKNRRTEGELDNIVAALDMDMIGVGGPPRIIDGGKWIDEPSVHHNKRLNDFVEACGKEIGVMFGHLFASWGTPEEGPLNTSGVPATCIWKPDDPNYHSLNENIDNIDWNAVRAVAQSVGLAAWRIAQSDIAFRS